MRHTMSGNVKRLVFLDLETMGVLPTSSVVQVGMLIAERVGSVLHPMVEWEYVVPYSEKEWALAQEGAAAMHAASGLREHSVEKYGQLVRDQGWRPVLTVATEQAIDFLSRHGFGPREAIIAGNSVGQDRVWLAVQMPRLHEYLHHRMVDVSSFRVIDGMFRSAEPPPKPHTAVADCRAAMTELNAYMGRFV